MCVHTYVCKYICILCVCVCVCLLPFNPESPSHFSALSSAPNARHSPSTSPDLSSRCLTSGPTPCNLPSRMFTATYIQSTCCLSPPSICSSAASASSLVYTFHGHSVTLLATGPSLSLSRAYFEAEFLHLKGMPEYLRWTMNWI